jgi:hypothetical protein
MSSRASAPAGTTTTGLVIAPRFCGPPGIGNGGYVSGMVAAYLEGPAEVTLRRPASLGTPLTVDRDAAGVRVLDGDALIAEAKAAADRSADLLAELPEPVPVEAARGAGASSRLRRRPAEHPFPGCFVCGARADGLGIMVGRVPGRDLLADAWTPAAEFADADGRVRPEFVSAALDCPGGFTAFGRPERDSGAADAGALYLLGRFTVRHLGPVIAGVPHAVVGWRLELDRRKLLAGSALFNADGQPVGIAHAVWIRLR